MRTAGGWVKVVVALALAAVVVALPLGAAGAVTTLTVTSANDAGPGTLRQHLSTAGTLDADVVIQFSPSVAQVDLTSGALAYNGGVGGAHELTIVGNGVLLRQSTVVGGRILTSQTTGTVRLTGVGMSGGNGGNLCGGAVATVGSLEVTDSSLIANSSTCGGGAIFAQGDVRISGSTLASNSSAVLGGAVYAPGHAVTVDESMLAFNTAPIGGGVVANLLSVEASTLHSNTSGNLGGAAYVGSATLTNATLQDNYAPNGGSTLLAEGSVGLVYTTISAGSVTDGSATVQAAALRSFGSVIAEPARDSTNCALAESTTSDGYNLADDTSCGFANAAGGDRQAAPAMLAPFAQPVDALPVRPPLSTSPLVDVIPLADCQDAGAAGIGTDQLGHARPAGAGCDIGAIDIAGAGLDSPRRWWRGTEGDLWSSPASWFPAGVPVDGDNLVISGSPGVMDLTGLDLASLTGTAATAGQTITVQRATPTSSVTIVGGVRSTGPGVFSFHPGISLSSGTHVFRSDGTIHLQGGLHGPGGIDVQGAGVTSLTEGSFDFLGQVRVQSGATLGVQGPSVGSGGAGTILEQGAALSVWASGQTVVEPIRVEAGTGDPGWLSGQGTLASPIDLRGQIRLWFSGDVTGPISGPGRLFPLGSTWYEQGEFRHEMVIRGANTYTGGTTVMGQPGITGSSPLGTGPVTVTGNGELHFAEDMALANDIELGPSFSGNVFATAHQVVLDGTIIGGAGTGMRAHLLGDATMDLAGGVATPRLEAVGSGLLTVSGPSDVGRLSASGAVIEVEAGAGPGSIGSIETHDPLDGSSVVNLRAPGLHDPAGSFDVSGFGFVDLWGHDQSASSVSMAYGATLHLGLIDGGVDAARLTTNGALSQLPGSTITYVLGADAHDQVRASSVWLGNADLWFAHDGSPSVGQVFRLIDNTGPNPVGMTYADAPEGSTYQAGQQLFRLSYVGGTGNDVTLTRLPGVHSTWDLGDVVEHGGGLRGGPGLSSWGPGRLDGWVSGLDRSVWHRWSQTGVGASWESLGGITLSTPAAVSQAPGQADVFIRGADNALWMRSYRGGWGPWTSLGGILTDGPSVTSSSPGNVAVTIRGGDGAVWLRRMVNGAWQGWTSLGGGTTHTPAVTDWGDGRLDVFIRGLDGALWQRTLAPGAPAGWIRHGGLLTEAPAVAAPSPGELAVFIRGADGILWHRSWEGFGWSDWRNLELPIDARPGVTGVGVGELELGVRGFDGSLWTFNGTGQSFDGGAAGAEAHGARETSGSSDSHRGGVPSRPVDDLLPSLG